MFRPLPEEDWKYMKKISAGLLDVLCKRINAQSIAILKGGAGLEHEKYLSHYRHIQESNMVVAECFDDWRRSTLLIKLEAIERQGLLAPDHLKRLSAETRAALEVLRKRCR